MELKWNHQLLEPKWSQKGYGTGFLADVMPTGFNIEVMFGNIWRVQSGNIWQSGRGPNLAAIWRTAIWQNRSNLARPPIWQAVGIFPIWRGAQSGEGPPIWPGIPIWRGVQSGEGAPIWPGIPIWRGAQSGEGLQSGQES